MVWKYDLKEVVIERGTRDVKQKRRSGDGYVGDGGMKDKMNASKIKYREDWKDGRGVRSLRIARTDIPGPNAPVSTNRRLCLNYYHP